VKLGAEPKKIAILGGLLLVAAVVAYFNYFSGDSSSTDAPRPTAAVPQTAPPVAVQAPAPANRTPEAGISRDDRRRAKANVLASEFSFRQGTEPGEEKPDPSAIDPTLRLDLLSKLQQVEAPSALRNIFQYGSAPPPPAAVVPLPAHPPTIALGARGPQAAPQAPGPPPPPPVPQAPQITWKYYGYKVSKADGRKQAFLLDGEEIIIAGENDAMKAGRYKVVRIGVNSITIEDTQFKSEQTLQLQPDAVV